MIQRSGLSALRRSPISRPTFWTASIVSFGSVSGCVKNCGACGSIAPPMIMEWLMWALSRSGGQGGFVQLVGGVPDRARNALVSGAAAQVAAHRLADLAVREVRLAAEQVPGRNQHAGGA